MMTENIDTKNYITTEKQTIIKIIENRPSEIEINQNSKYVKLKLDNDSEVEVHFDEPSIIKIYCNTTLSPNNWAKLLKFNTWQEIFDRYDTWEELLKDTSIS